jgi:hypothetical protein
MANIFNSELFAQLEKQVNVKGNEVYKINLKQGEICLNALDTFKSEKGKDFLTKDGNKFPTIAEFIAKYFETSKSNFYRLIEAHKVSAEVREKYEQQEKGVKTITKLIAFDAKDAKGTETEGTETEAKVKVETELKISVKGDKITIKGNCENTQIDLLIAELQRIKAAKNSPKAA